MLRLLRNTSEDKTIPPIQIGDMFVDVKRHPRARRLSIRYNPKKQRFVLSSPKRSSKKSMFEFVTECEKWMRKQVVVAPPPVYVRPGSMLPLEGRDRLVNHIDGPGVHVDLTEDQLTITCRIDRFPRALQRYLQQRAYDVIAPLAHQKAATINKPIKLIQLRDTITRWGSCTHDGKLSFSWRLILATPDIIDYVVAHEVAHLQVFNHSETFWKLCRTLTPHTTFGKHWLQQQGNNLHQISIIAPEIPTA